jgi:phosphate-selective porin OprO/OprP
VAFLLAAAASACALPENDSRSALPGPVTQSFGAAFVSALGDLGRYPVVPPSEDVQVGDVFALSAPPAMPGSGERDGLRAMASARWTSIRPGASSGRSDPGTDAGLVEEGGRAGMPRVRRSAVDLRDHSELALTESDLEALLSPEIVALLDAAGEEETLVGRVRAGAAESQAAALESLMEELCGVRETLEVGRVALRPEYLETLTLEADPGTGLVYLVVVSEVLGLRSLEALILREGARRDAAASTSETPELAAVQRARAMNEALAEAQTGEGIDGSIQFVAMADEVLGLRRSWPRPLAVAVRGLTLEVDAATGEIVRSAPIGVELPPLTREVETAEFEEESLVLEERRRGAQQVDVEPRRGLSWDYGPRFDALDGDLTLFLGGRLHMDVAGFGEDEEIELAFGPADPGYATRRAFVELGGVYRRFDFNLWVNFSDVSILSDQGEEEVDFDGVDFRNVFVGTRNLPVVGGVRVGYFKEPFGLEETTSSNDITFLERSLTDTFIKRRNFGVRFDRRFTERRQLTAALGIYRDMDNNLEFGDGTAVTGRVTGTPIMSEDERRVLHLGGAVTFRVPDGDTLRFSSRPESVQGQVMVDTGSFAADGDVRFGLELGSVHGPLSFQSETIYTAVDGGPGVGNPSFWATYVMGSYVLTGQHRTYRERTGAFGSVFGDTPTWWYGGGPLEAAVRYSYLDLESGSIDGGILHDVTLGLNWYVGLNARWMLNYIIARPEGVGTEQILQSRLQLTF